MTPDELTPPMELALGEGDGDSEGAGASVEEALELLREGEVTIEGRLVEASNATFYCGISRDGRQAAGVYKPVAGERPLWDFPDGTLAGREVAAYEVSAVTGWALVPPTVYRDGPAGPGMVQLWIDADVEVNLARFMRRYEDVGLRRLAVFDAVINNADRKGGHLLPTRDGHVYGVDHGVTFSVEDKLRTVLWQWAGSRLPDEACEVLTRLRAELDAGLGERLADLLTRREIRRTRARVDALLVSGLHPEPNGDWPPVPWPPI